MTAVDIVAWATIVVILASYGLVARRPKYLRLFNWVNLVGGVLLAVYNVQNGVLPTAALSGAYALIAFCALARR